MQISQTEIDNAINGIIGFFNRRSQSVFTKPEFLKLQDQSICNLDGIAFLFLGDRSITLQVTNAKLGILDERFHENKFELTTHASECLDDFCLGECKTQSSDVQNAPARSAVAVAQDRTITCTSCNGFGIDKLDVSPCDNCSGTGRQIVHVFDHDCNCQCLICLPYGPGLESIFLTPDNAGVL